MARFHFISGLPRSGSTLTAAILLQNPAFHAGISSPLASLVDGLVEQVSAGTELASMVTQLQRERLLRGLFESYYADYDHEVIFDTNRAWTSKLDLLMRLYPDAKLICLARDVSWIMDSLERQFRQNTFEHTRLFNNASERSTVYTRVEALANANRLVGFPWHALKEAAYSDYADRLVILDYDLLVARPEDVFRLLYEFLELEWFEHDFKNLKYDAQEFDAHLGLQGLHHVEGEVRPRPRQTILPPDLFERYSKLAFWRDLSRSKAYRLVVKSDERKSEDMMPDPKYDL